MSKLGQKLTGKTAVTDYPIGIGTSKRVAVELYENIGNVTSKDIVAAANKSSKFWSTFRKANMETYASSSPSDKFKYSYYNVYYKPVLSPSYAKYPIERYLLQQPSMSKETSYSINRSSNRYNVPTYQSIPRYSESQTVSVPDRYSERPVRGNDGSYSYPSGGSSSNYYFSMPQYQTPRYPSYSKKQYATYQETRITRPISTRRYTSRKDSRKNEKNYLPKIKPIIFNAPKIKRISKRANLTNMILPIKTDWLKAIKYWKKAPSVSTIELLPTKRKGLKQVSKLTGFNFKRLF